MIFTEPKAKETRKVVIAVPDMDGDKDDVMIIEESEYCYYS